MPYFHPSLTVASCRPGSLASHLYPSLFASINYTRLKSPSPDTPCSPLYPVCVCNGTAPFYIVVFHSLHRPRLLTHRSKVGRGDGAA